MSRYPYTEAYDFIRSQSVEWSTEHQMALPTLSRSQCARVCHAVALAFEMSAEDVAKKIADYARAKEQQ